MRTGENSARGVAVCAGRAVSSTVHAGSTLAARLAVDLGRYARCTISWARRARWPTDRTAIRSPVPRLGRTIPQGLLGDFQAPGRPARPATPRLGTSWREVSDRACHSTPPPLSTVTAPSTARGWHPPPALKRREGRFATHRRWAGCLPPLPQPLLTRSRWCEDYRSPARVRPGSVCGGEMALVMPRKACVATAGAAKTAPAPPLPFPTFPSPLFPSTAPRHAARPACLLF